MADPKKVKVFDGTNWVDLKADDPNLPISSTDDKVTLSDDGSGKFQIETGDPTTDPSGKAVRVEVDSIGHVAINGQDSDETIPRTNTMLEVVSDATSPFVLILDGTESIGVYAGRFGIRQYGTSTNYEYCIDDTNGTYMFSGGANSRSSIINGDTYADILVKPNEYVRLTPETRTDKITSKAGLANGPKIELGDNKSIRLSTDFYERVVIEEDGTMTSEMGTTLPDTNRTAYKINETGNSGDNSFSIDWVFANGAFANTDAQGRMGVRREGSDVGSANFSMEFFVASRPTGTSDSDVLTKALEIRYDGQLIAKDDYEPQTDNSLVTKGYVTNVGGGMGTLPISDNRDPVTVTLDSPSANTFTVSTAGETALSVGPYQTVGIGTAASRSTVLHVKGTPNRESSTDILSDLCQTVGSGYAYGFFQQFTIDAPDAVVGEFKAFFAKGLYGAGKATHYTGYQCEPIGTGADNVTAFRSRVNVSATGGTNYAFYSEGSAVSHFNGALEVPRIVGSAAPASDASIALGADCQILVGATQSYGLRIRADGNVAVGGLGGSTSRFSVQGTVGGEDVYGANIIPDFNHNVTISTANAIQVNPKFSSDVTQAFLYTNAKLTTTDKVGRLTAFNYTIDYNDPAAKEATSENRAFATNLRKAEGKDNWAIIASGDAPSFFAGDVRNPAGSNPENDDSLVTKGWVESVVGSGGSANPDTVPGTGANFRWNEKVISVPNTINGVRQTDQQIFRTLYAYDGIFTDGLHWTADGYHWHTSDQSLKVGMLEGNIDYDLGRVCKGTGNEYVVSQYISNDMKSWRRLAGVSGHGVVYLSGEIYHSDCSYKLDRASSSWQSTGFSAAIGGSMTSSPSRLVACMESGLYAVILSAVDGTAHWTVALDGEPVPYRAIGNGITDGLSICFSERLQKWMIASEDTFWISDDANVSATNWTSMSLPTAANWDRMVDDGGTISIASTDDNANVVLYCQEPSGPAAASDWQTTALYNNRWYRGFCGTNGRTIGSMKDEGERTDPVTGDTFDEYYYALSGDIRLDNSVNTSQINLVSPTRDLRDLNPPAGLATQADANQFMAAEIAKRALVVTLTQDAYDAIPADEIDDSTLYLITS